MNFLDRRPVLSTLLTGFGVAMLAAGLLLLLAPLHTLDRLWALGSGKLALLGALLLLGAMAVTAFVAGALSYLQPAEESDADEP